MTTPTKNEIKFLVGILSVLLSIFGTTYKLGQQNSEESARIYQAINDVKNDNKLQDKDIATINQMMLSKSDKSDVDNLRERVNAITRYRSTNRNAE